MHTGAVCSVVLTTRADMVRGPAGSFDHVDPETACCASCLPLRDAVRVNIFVVLSCGVLCAFVRGAVSGAPSDTLTRVSVWLRGAQKETMEVLDWRQRSIAACVVQIGVWVVWRWWFSLRCVRECMSDVSPVVSQCSALR